MNNYPAILRELCIKHNLKYPDFLITKNNFTGWLENTLLFDYKIEVNWCNTLKIVRESNCEIELINNTFLELIEWLNNPINFLKIVVYQGV